MDFNIFQLSSESFFNFVWLESKTRYTLGKTERLKSRKAIDLLFKTGKSFSVFPFRVVFSKNVFNEKHFSNLQCAFSVSKRYFKKAVDRNRIKRLMREAYRLQKNELQTRLNEQKQSLHVFIMFTGNELPQYDVVFTKMGNVVKKLLKEAYEEAGTNT